MRLRAVVTVAWAVMAGISGSASAQISLSSAVDLALRNDPKLKMAQADVDKAKAALSQVIDAYVPAVSAHGGIGDSVGVPLSLPVIFSISSESLVFNSSEHDYIRSARAALNAAVLAKQESHDQVAEEALLTYLHLDNALRRQAAMKQEFEYANRLVSIVQDRVDAGQDAHVELVRARRAADAAQYEQFQVDDEVAALSEQLAVQTGLTGSKLTTVSSSIPSITVRNTATEPPVSYGIESAFSSAQSKQEKAWGDKHYWGRPQIGLGMSYSRVSTIGTNYAIYYPQFSATNLAENHISLNSLSLGIEVKIPLLDMAHQAIARESAADARHAMYEAQSQRQQFLAGRFKLSHTAAELVAAEKLAEDDQELAQEDLDTLLLQLSSSSSDPNKPVMTPKDEQRARVQERERTIDLLNTQFQLQQTQVNLLRQTGQLDEWLRAAIGPVTPPLTVK